MQQQATKYPEGERIKRTHYACTKNRTHQTIEPALTSFFIELNIENDKT